MHSTPLEFLIQVIVLLTSYILISLIIRRFTKLITPKVLKVLKYLLVFQVIAMMGSAFGQYQTFWSMPQSFQQGLRLLENSPSITSRIGELNGYSWIQSKEPKHEDNPVTLALTLSGPRADLYVEVVLVKDENSRIWSILEFKKDSLVSRN